MNEPTGSGRAAQAIESAWGKGGEQTEDLARARIAGYIRRRRTTSDGVRPRYSRYPQAAGSISCLARLVDGDTILSVDGGRIRRKLRKSAGYRIVRTVAPIWKPRRDSSGEGTATADRRCSARTVAGWWSRDGAQTDRRFGVYRVADRAECAFLRKTGFASRPQGSEGLARNCWPPRMECAARHRAEPSIPVTEHSDRRPRRCDPGAAADTRAR
ncbi:hypothetical protein FHT01_000263 [Sphingomonas japonica]|uniref:Uncharacterized protein n=1 Tax=Sphingomonas japonica TaxID=511662 RepID=A0ABX0U0B2_9SPHN|nr:hypothetical protein [Sphingomonas japonica]